jgi:predicted DNA-binding protein
MGRKKVDRSDKVMQSFETTRPLKIRLEELAQKRYITVSALIREILEKHFEERNEFNF